MLLLPDGGPRRAHESPSLAGRRNTWPALNLAALLARGGPLITGPLRKQHTTATCTSRLWPRDTTDRGTPTEYPVTTQVAHQTVVPRRQKTIPDVLHVACERGPSRQLHNSTSTRTCCGLRWRSPTDGRNQEACGGGLTDRNLRATLADGESPH